MKKFLLIHLLFLFTIFSSNAETNIVNSKTPGLGIWSSESFILSPPISYLYPTSAVASLELIQGQITNVSNTAPLWNLIQGQTTTVYNATPHWQKASGPGNVIFENAFSWITKIEVTIPGEYRIQCSVNPPWKTNLDFSIKGNIVLGPVAIPPVLPTIIWPIELFSHDGIDQSSRSFAFTNDVTKQYSLFLHVQGLEYAGKLEVQVNTNSWIPITDTFCFPLEKAFGGINGGYSVVRFLIPLSTNTLISGNNTINFKQPNQSINKRKTATRIVKFNIRNLNDYSTNSNYISKDKFVEEDPKTWVPIYNDPSLILAGKDIFTRIDIDLTNEFSKPIKAKCSTCHDINGRDLAYFGYSNKSIVERTKFHGLTQYQGELIASYIRTLPVEPLGRPYNPSYQPGPGLSAKPVKYWAAGAGLDAVLEKDADMIPYIFPTGITATAISPDKTLSPIDTPSVIQYYTWNRWLPILAPIDAWPSNTLASTKLLSYYDNSKPGIDVSYYNLRAQLKVHDIAALQHNMYLFGSWIVERTDNPTFLSHGWNNDPILAQKQYGTAQWIGVKMWELMTEFQLEDIMGQAAYGVTNRLWYGRFVFDFSFNIMKFGDTNGILNDKAVTHRYNSIYWYALQTVLNDGNRAFGYGRSQQPVDYPYMVGLLKDTYNLSGVPLGMEQYKNLVHSYQSVTNNIGPEKWNSGGFCPKNSDCYVFTFSDFQGHWKDIPTSQKKQLFEAYLRNYINKYKQFPVNSYYTGDPFEGHPGITTSTYIPKPTIEVVGDAMLVLFNGPYSLNNLGIDKGLQNEILDIGKSIWPKYNWDQHRPL